MVEELATPIKSLTDQKIYRSCLLDLWNDVLQQELQEEIYRADMAGLSHEMKAMEKGLILKISGYSEHLHLLVDSTTSGMRTATEALTPKMFEAVRELRARTYHNDLIQVPDLAEDVLMNVLQEPYTSLRDKAVWLNKITLEDLQGFGRELFKKMYLQVLIQGNIPWYQAIGIAKKVHSDLQWESLPDKEELEIKVHQLPLGERRVRVLSLNKLSTNSIVTNYYQGEVSTYKERAVIYQIVKMMEEDLFYTLRTKEQLCYTLSNDRRSTFGVLGFSISVLTQVNKYSIQHVDQRIEAFLRNYLRELQTLDPRTCDPDDNLIQLHKADDTFYEEMERNWKEIISKEYNFERQFRVWAADEDLTMADIIDWMKNHLASSNKSMFRKLSVQIVGHNESKDDNKPAVEPGQSQTTAYKLTYLNREAKEKASEFITNIDMFKKNLPFMTVPKVQT